MRRLLLPVMLLLGCLLKAQNPEFEGYNFTTFPVPNDIDTVKPVDGSVITLERHITDVYLNKDNLFEEIDIFHRKIRVYSHEAINNFNKIYVPVSNVIAILDIRARFISPDGKITEVPKESIREAQNLDNKGNFNVFAIEGAVTGGEIEYYYKLRRRFDPYGTVYMQGDEPRTNVQVIFAFPSKLEYLVKSYNRFPDFSTRVDTLLGKTFMTAECKVIASQKEEKYASKEAGLMRYEYTLAYNGFNGIVRSYSFAKVGSNFYENLYMPDKKSAKAVKSCIQKLKLDGLNEAQKIRKIEDFVKEDIALSEDLGTTPGIDQMLKLKQTTTVGSTKLMVALLNEAGVNFELVCTTKQTDREFDPDFNGWNFLDDYLIYFPSLDKVVLPDNRMYRLGITPSAYEGGFGLFLHPVSYGNFHSLAWNVKKLPVDSYLKNADSMDVHLVLNPEGMNLDADVSRVFYGEWAASYQAYWNFMNEDDRKQQISQIFNMGTENTTINSYKVSHETPSDIAVNPFRWDVNLTAHSLVEQAGNDLIIKIGESIGEQSELYQETERKLPITVFDLHNYYRKIAFDIPEGYSVSNLDDLNMSVELLNNGKVSCCFRSWYELNGKQLVIYSKEYYTEMHYPVTRFEEFRKVINAAADFNKKTILLTKI
jgi:hypothetical protein